MAVRMDALVSAIAREAGLDPDRVAQDKTNIYAWVNDTRRELEDLPVHHSSLEFSGEMVGVANVTAGTVAATQNQAEVTGSSTAWTTAMSGRYIQIGTSSPWQRISYVSDSTHLTLESSWNDSTVTSQPYTIWKRDYELPAAVDRVTRLVDMASPNNEVAYYAEMDFRRKYGIGATFSTPVVAFTTWGQRDFSNAFLGTTVYASVTTTAMSPIVDFASGAGLVTGLAPGDRLLIGNSTTSTAYFVEKVLTDSRVALADLVQVSISSQSATALSLNRTFIRFFPSVAGTNRILYWEGFKKVWDITSSADYVEPGWYSAIKSGAIYKCATYTNDPRRESFARDYDLAVKELIRNQYRARNPTPRLQPIIPARYGYRGRIFPSDRDTGE